MRLLRNERLTGSELLIRNGIDVWVELKNQLQQRCQRRIFESMYTVEFVVCGRHEKLLSLPFRFHYEAYYHAPNT